MKFRQELDAALDDLARRLPAMIARHPEDADFWPEFAGLADEVTENTGASDWDYVQTRLDALSSARDQAPS